jgi:UDP-N-acetyl-D-glucosamine dehydrogenase
MSIEIGVDPLLVLAERIRSKQARIAVVGLGYVGLPLLLTAGNAGYETLGFDVNHEKIEQLRSGRSYIVDVSDSEVASAVFGEFSADPAVLSRADVMVICVPTPLTDRTPDLSMVRAAAGVVGRHLQPGRLVVLESTTYPGTTEEIMRPILEGASGLEAGKDFALAYSPERIDPGQSTRRLENTPKIVAGLSPRCRELATSFYSHFVREVVTTSTMREAEMAKLIENTFRQVNIALVNELAIVAHDMDVDIWEALQAASTKPFGYMPFWPGPGVGGHCISIDPSYLSWRADQQIGHRIEFIEHANDVNNRMPKYVASRIGEALNEAGKALKGSRILCIGIAYKAGVNDLRESPSLLVAEHLVSKGAEISYHDPFVPRVDISGLEYGSNALEEAVLEAQDCVAILTPHPGLDVRRVLRSSPLVFDARGVTAGIDATNVVRL